MRIQLAGDLSAPALARDFVANQLDRSPDPEAPWPTDDVVLVASELVTNAVQAGAHSITVEILLDSGRIELEVEDDAQGWPTPRIPQPDEVHGRGLAITDAVADHWAVAEHDPLKVVRVSWLGKERLA